MQQVDLHIHTHLSPDGKGRMQEFYDTAFKNGIKLMCFTDHLDFEYGWNPQGLNAVLSQGREEFDELEQKPETKALFGLELAYQKEFEEEAKEAVKEIKPDFIIGSVHEIDGLGFSGGNVRKYFDEFGKKSFAKYFDVLLEFAENGVYDVIGHFDIVKRNSTKCGYELKIADYKSVVRDILNTVISKGRGIEINTSGIRQLPEEPFPGMQVVEWFFEDNGSILTIGSDTHVPDFVGVGCEYVIENLALMGISSVSYFEDRIEKKFQLA